MRFLRKTRGAVSIFLVIILLPTCTVAGLFLDVSRTRLAQEVVSSSADLALNTVLSDYDRNLKDYFGLLASAQDTSEVIAISKQYFVDSMVSAGVTTSDAEAYADQIISVFAGDEDISDMLCLLVDGEVKITPTEHGTMDNPALLKEGIIEFMKYRSPVNGVVDLFAKITDSDVAAQVQNSSKETEMIEAKKEFYEAEKKLIEQAEKAYEAIKKYEDYTTWTGEKITNENFLHNMSTFLASPDGTGNGFEAVFQSAHEKMVMNLYNTHESDGTLSVTLLKKKNITAPSSVNTYSDSNKASSDDIETLISNFNTAMNTYYIKRTNLNTAWQNVGAKQSSDYPIQYWVALTNACDQAYSDYISAAEALWKLALKLQNAADYSEEDAMSERMKKPANNNVSFEEADADGKLSLQSIYDTLMEVYNGSLKSEVEGRGVSSYKNINSQITALDIDSNNQKLKLETVSEIYNIRNKLNQYQSDFDRAMSLAKTAKDETNKLKKLLEDYKKAFEEWKEIVNDQELDDCELATKEGGDRDQIAELEQTGIELFSESSVTELAGRLGNIQTLCKTFRDDLKSIKYNGTAVINISDYAKFRSAARLAASKIVRNESSLRQYVTESFSFAIGTEIQRIEIYDNRTSENLSDGSTYAITDSFHTNIEKTRLELLEWMKAKFDSPVAGNPTTAARTGFDVNDKSSAKDADSSISGKSEDTGNVDTTENTTGHDFSEWDGATLPSEGEGAAEEQSVTAKLSEVSKFVADIFSNFNETFMNSLVNMRDDLYMTDYVFSMFTYDTFDYEGCYALLDESEQKGLKSSSAKEKYADVMSQWQSSNDNKTLTLTPRNSANNWAYGGEIEYILYGNSSNATNKTTAYARIYMIRYALDVSAVFNVYWDDDILNMIAEALEAYAFIPASLTKTVACLAITAAEAGIDISYLKAGLPTVLCKTEDDLICNYQSVFMDSDESTVSDSNRIKLQYSDYLKIFLFLKLIGSNENVIYTRCADVIQSNITLVTNNKTFALSKSQVYYDFNATVLVEPMWSRLLAIDKLGDLTSAKGWRTMTIDITRGY